MHKSFFRLPASIRGEILSADVAKRYFSVGNCALAGGHENPLVGGNHLTSLQNTQHSSNAFLSSNTTFIFASACQ